MFKKSRPKLYRNFLYKMEDFLGRQYVLCIQIYPITVFLDL